MNPSPVPNCRETDNPRVICPGLRVPNRAIEIAEDSRRLGFHARRHRHEATARSKTTRLTGPLTTGRKPSRSRQSYFDRAVKHSQMIAKLVAGIGCSLLQVTGEIQLCAQGASSLDCFCLLPFPFPNCPGSRR